MTVYVCPECGRETEQPDGTEEAVCFNVTKHKRGRPRRMEEKK